MPYARVRSLNETLAQRDRRLVTGLAVSVLLHGVVLSLQFGIPGFDAAPGGPIQVRLAPLPPSATEPLPTPVAAPEPALPPVPAQAPAPARGMRLLDPRAEPVVAQAVPPTPKPVASPARRKQPTRRAPVAPPVIASTQQDAAFAVAPSLPEMEPDTVPDIASADVEDAPDPLVTAREDEQAREAERQRQQEAERTAAVLAQQQRDAERQLREEQERLAQQRLADQQLAERRQEEQRTQELRQAQQLAAEQAAIAEQQLEERRRLDAEQQRLAQLRLREEALARQQAQQAAADRLAAEEAERRRVQAQLEAQARQRAEELAQRQAAEEGARRLAQERAEAERLARERLEEAGRRAAAERLQAQAVPGEGSPGPGGPGKGIGSGEGSRPPGAVPGSAMATRARELLRGLSIPSVEPPPARRLNPFAGARRVVSDGAEGDVPLRLYVDSVRQKLERNAILGGARFGVREVRIDPLVSLSLRSDGSIDDVTIVRSSGRADMDEAVRRFVQLNARYSAFPPNVAARFDVIEIRRVWRFVDGLKLLEEMR